jgi:exonuclease III
MGRYHFTKHTIKSLNILQWNVKSFYARLPHIHQAIDELHPDILCLQETWLKNHNKINIKRFHDAVRFDRVGRTGGGVMILIRQSIPFSIIDLNSRIESCAAKLYLPSGTISICCLYLPADISNNRNLMR